MERLESRRCLPGGAMRFDCSFASGGRIPLLCLGLVCECQLTRPRTPPCSWGINAASPAPRGPGAGHPPLAGLPWLRGRRTCLASAASRSRQGESGLRSRAAGKRVQGLKCWLLFLLNHLNFERRGKDLFNMPLTSCFKCIFWGGNTAEDPSNTKGIVLQGGDKGINYGNPIVLSDSL